MGGVGGATLGDLLACLLTGSRRMLDVIDCTTQESLTMSLGAWVRYYQSAQRERTLNVISLEFSCTEMDSLVEPPTLVCHVCLQAKNSDGNVCMWCVCAVVCMHVVCVHVVCVGTGEAVRLGGACLAQDPHRSTDRPNQ